MTKLNTLKQVREIDPVEDMFFKKRTLFGIDSDRYREKPVENDEYYVDTHSGVVDNSGLDDSVRKYLYEGIGEETVERRLNREDCTLFLARQTGGSNEVAGYYWSVSPNTGAVWHDSFRVDPGEALVFDGFVDPAHRRSGVYSLLQAASHNYVVTVEEVATAYTIVENRNDPSMAANKKFGLEEKANNYLVKMLSINIFSVVDYGGRRVTRFVLLRGNL